MHLSKKKKNLHGNHEPFLKVFHSDVFAFPFRFFFFFFEIQSPKFRNLVEGFIDLHFKCSWYHDWRLFNPPLIPIFCNVNSWSKIIFQTVFGCFKIWNISYIWFLFILHDRFLAKKKKKNLMKFELNCWGLCVVS